MMGTRHLHTLPVYSQEYPNPNYWIGKTRLLKHQVETWEAFNDPNVDVIFNTATKPNQMILRHNASRGGNNVQLYQKE